MRRRLPRLELTADGIGIELKRHRDIVIPFADVDELKIVTRDQAQPYAGFQVGPHVTLAMQQARELAAFLRGHIERPTVLHQIEGSGTSLLMRGRHLLYLIAIDAEDADAVMNAYAAFRVRAPRPLRGAAAPPSPFARSGVSGR